MSCKCEASIGNTGLPNCQSLMSVARNFIVVPTFDSTGAKNFISTAATLNAAYFSDRINHADGSKRWYPIVDLKNVTAEKGDSIYESFDDQSKIFIQEGIRSVNALIAKQGPTYLKKIKDYRCTEVSLYVIDKAGNLIGSLDEAGKLYPIRIDNESWDPVLVWGSDTTVQKILLKFDFDIDAKDENLEMILASDIPTINLLNLKGLLDVYAVYSNITTTGFRAKLTYSFGSVITKNPVKGLVVTDFVSEITAATSKVRNTTTSADVALTSVTESADGQYDFVFAAQTSANILHASAKKDGFDFSTLNDDPITIP